MFTKNQDCLPCGPMLSRTSFSVETWCAALHPMHQSWGYFSCENMISNTQNCSPCGYPLYRTYSHVDTSLLGLLPICAHDIQGSFPVRYMLSRIPSPTGIRFPRRHPTLLQDIQDIISCQYHICRPASLTWYPKLLPVLARDFFSCEYMTCRTSYEDTCYLGLILRSIYDKQDFLPGVT